MGKKVQSGTPRWILIATALVGLVSAIFVAAAKYYEIHKARAEAEKAQVELLPKGETKPSEAPTSASRRPVSAAHDQTVVRRDLAGLPVAARENRRYLSLTHLHQDPRISESALASIRDGLAELAAYLSPAGTVASFTPVDDERLVFAIDWPAFGTPTATVWRAVLAAYPYGLDRSDGYGAALRDLSGTSLPLVRGDWFLRAALKPPLAGAEGPLHRPGTVPVALQKFARQYDEQRIDPAIAAAELGVVGPKDVTDKVRAEWDLFERYGLGPLADGGSVSRATWESTVFSTSPYQELARCLDIGTPLQGD